VLGEFSKVCNQLIEDETIETSLIILPEHFDDFEQYLDMIDLCEQLLIMENLEGVFQVASFHPQYLFAGSDESDASNYTNRSPFPMIHILREDSLTTAIDKHVDVDSIPENNIKNVTVSILSNPMIEIVSGNNNIKFDNIIIFTMSHNFICLINN
jgi:hypothetical protein